MRGGSHFAHNARADALFCQARLEAINALGCPEHGATRRTGVRDYPDSLRQPKFAQLRLDGCRGGAHGEHRVITGEPIQHPRAGKNHPSGLLQGQGARSPPGRCFTH